MHRSDAAPGVTSLPSAGGERWRTPLPRHIVFQEFQAHNCPESPFLAKFHDFGKQICKKPYKITLLIHSHLPCGAVKPRKKGNIFLPLHDKSSGYTVC
jgi:hypothetical protein